MTCILIKKENLDTQGEHLVKTKAEISRMHLQSKEHQRPAGDHQQLREAWSRCSLTILRRNQLPNLCGRAPGLQNCLRIHFCCLRHPVALCQSNPGKLDRQLTWKPRPQTGNSKGPDNSVPGLFLTKGF